MPSLIQRSTSMWMYPTLVHVVYLCQPIGILGCSDLKRTPHCNERRRSHLRCLRLSSAQHPCGCTRRLSTLCISASPSEYWVVPPRQLLTAFSLALTAPYVIRETTARRTHREVCTRQPCRTAGFVYRLHSGA